MYNRYYSSRRGLKPYFVRGVNEFVDKAQQNIYYKDDGGIRCICLKCNYCAILKDEMVKVHLYKVGFKPNYWIWIDDGEETSHVDLLVEDNCMGVLSSGADVTQVE